MPKHSSQIKRLKTKLLYSLLKIKLLQLLPIRKRNHILILQVSSTMKTRKKLRKQKLRLRLRDRQIKRMLKLQLNVKLEKKQKEMNKTESEELMSNVESRN
jgi:hypothetical protein